MSKIYKCPYCCAEIDELVTTQFGEAVHMVCDCCQGIILKSGCRFKEVVTEEKPVPPLTALELIEDYVYNPSPNPKYYINMFKKALKREKI